MKTAEEVLAAIDNALLSEGYDTWRQDQSTDFEKVGEAFSAFFIDWQATKAGELRDEIERLRALLERYQVANYIPEDCDLYAETQAILNQQETKP